MPVHMQGTCYLHYPLQRNHWCCTLGNPTQQKLLTFSIWISIISLDILASKSPASSYQSLEFNIKFIKGVLCLVVHNFSLFIEFIGWYWLTKVYRFQVHNSTPHHLYTVLCVHHSISVHHHLSPLYPSLPPPSNHHTIVSMSVFFFFLSAQFFHLSS